MGVSIILIPLLIGMVIGVITVIYELHEELNHYRNGGTRICWAFLPKRSSYWKRVDAALLSFYDAAQGVTDDFLLWLVDKLHVGKDPQAEALENLLVLTEAAIPYIQPRDQFVGSFSEEIRAGIAREDLDDALRVYKEGA